MVWFRPMRLWLIKVNHNEGGLPFFYASALFIGMNLYIRFWIKFAL